MVARSFPLDDKHIEIRGIKGGNILNFVLKFLLIKKNNFKINHANSNISG